MPVEVVSMMCIAAGLVAVLLLCVGIEIIVDRLKDFLLGNNRISIKQCRSELELHKSEMSELKARLDRAASSPTGRQAHAIPSPARTSQVALENVWSLGNEAVFRHADSWSRDADAIGMSIAPTIAEVSLDESWTREACMNGKPTARTIADSTSVETWARDTRLSEQPRPQRPLAWPKCACRTLATSRTFRSSKSW